MVSVTRSEPINHCAAGMGDDRSYRASESYFTKAILYRDSESYFTKNRPESGSESYFTKEST